MAMAIINGTDGDDLLLAEGGGNTLTGGAGQDLFQISAIGTIPTPNIITDFDQLSDTIQIDLPSGSQTTDLVTTQTGNDATISLGSIPLVIVQNTLVSALDNLIVVISDAVNNLAPTDIIFSNAVTAVDENANTANRIKVADFTIADDNVGINSFSLVGEDADKFEIDGTSLFLKAGTVLDFETKASFEIDINVDDPTVGFTPDTIGNFVLTVNNIPEAPRLNSSTPGIIQLSQSDTTNATLTFKKISRQTSSRNELGLFAVDDNQGTINGVTPNQSGYVDEVLKRSQVVFSSLSDNAIDSIFDSQSIRTINIPANATFGFYLATNGTIDDAANNIVFSFPSSNNSFQNAKITPVGNGIQVAFEETSGGGDQDFNDLVFQIQNATGASPVGITQQSSREIYDLTAIVGNANATFTINRDAAFNNHISFYRVEDAQGSIKVGNDLIKPGDSGYLQAAIQNRIAGVDLVGTNGQATTSSGNFQGGALYAPLLIANSATASADFSNVYTAYRLGNADKADHIRLLGDNTFGFEDLAGGGDRDFNDVIIKATFS
jgi:Domain of unknown function (DUF4114)